MLTATMLPATAQAAPAGSCSVPIVSQQFDQDQTGGWWAVSISMRCNWKYTKAYNVSVYNRQTSEKYFFWAKTTTDSTWSRVVTVPSTPPGNKEKACVDAEAAYYGPNEDPLGGERKYVCFLIATPA